MAGLTLQQFSMGLLPFRDVQGAVARGPDGSQVVLLGPLLPADGHVDHGARRQEMVRHAGRDASGSKRKVKWPVGIKADDLCAAEKGTGIAAGAGNRKLVGTASAVSEDGDDAAIIVPWHEGIGHRDLR